MTCRCPSHWPVLHAWWRAQRWTLTRQHLGLCGLPAELLDPCTWRTR